MQRRRRLLVLGIGHARYGEAGIGHEYQLAPGPKHPGGFRDPAQGIGPEGGAVLGDREIETVVCEWQSFADALDQRDGQPMPGAQAIRRGKLVRRRVNADDLPASPCHPGADVGGSAADFEATLVGEVVRQQLEFALREFPDSPIRILCRPSVASAFSVARRELLPGRAVAADVIAGRVHRFARVLMSSMRVANARIVAATASTPAGTWSYCRCSMASRIQGSVFAP